MIDISASASQARPVIISCLPPKIIPRETSPKPADDNSDSDEAGQQQQGDTGVASKTTSFASNVAVMPKVSPRYQDDDDDSKIYFTSLHTSEPYKILIQICLHYPFTLSVKLGWFRDFVF